MHACINLAEQFLGGFSYVSSHFVFTKLFHQITPFWFGGGRTIYATAVAGGGTQALYWSQKGGQGIPWINNS